MAVIPFTDFVLSSAPCPTSSFKISALLYLAANIAGVIPFEVALTSAPNSISFLTVSKSPFTIDMQKGLTEIFVFTRVVAGAVVTVVVALEVEKANPNAIAEIMIVFFMMNDF